MNRFLLPAVFAAVILASCASGPEKWILDLPDTQGSIENPRLYSITDHKNKTGPIPEWLSSDIQTVEALDAYRDRFVFISRAEGTSFNALNHWKEGFSTEQDFPRLAAARIEARFSVSAPFPDQEYGAFFEALIRAASDAQWIGAVREDDFWIQRKFTFVEAAPEIPAEDPDQAFDEQIPPQEREDWEFFILVTMEKNLFASQFDAVFREVNPSPRPTRDQVSAASRVKDRFFDGF